MVETCLTIDYLTMKIFTNKMNVKVKGKMTFDVEADGNASNLRGQKQSVRDYTWQQAEEKARPGHEGGRRDDGQAHTVLRPGRVGGLRRQGGGGLGKPENRHEKEHGGKVEVVFDTKAAELK